MGVQKTDAVKMTGSQKTREYNLMDSKKTRGYNLTGAQKIDEYELMDSQVNREYEMTGAGLVVVGWLGRGTTALHCTHLVLTHMLKS